MEIEGVIINVGIVAAIVSFVAHPLYIISIIAGETNPHPTTWISEAVLSGVSLFFLIEAGGGDVQWMLWGDFIGFTLIASFTFYKFGYNNFFKQFFGIDSIVCFFGVFASIVVFMISKSALLALIATLASEIFALWPTIHKTYKYPNEESELAWILTSLGDAINIGAMQWGNFADMWYVFTVFLVDGLVLFLIAFSPMTREWIHVIQNYFRKVQRVLWKWT